MSAPIIVVSHRSPLFCSSLPQPACLLFTKRLQDRVYFSLTGCSFGTRNFWENEDLFISDYYLGDICRDHGLADPRANPHRRREADKSHRTRRRSRPGRIRLPPSNGDGRIQASSSEAISWIKHCRGKWPRECAGAGQWILLLFRRLGVLSAGWRSHRLWLWALWYLSRRASLEPTRRLTNDSQVVMLEPLLTGRCSAAETAESRA